MPQKKIKFLYENLSLANLPNEKWKDVPGFEGSYKISNFGRVKSLKRLLNSSRGKAYMTEAKILKNQLAIKLNKTIKEPIYSLVITLSRDGTIFKFPVPRLVYFLFVQKFDLNNKRIFISPKDHDGRNVQPSNLLKGDMSTIKLVSYKKGRAVSHLKKLSRPVTQFDHQGNPINSFPSMYEAGKSLGIGERNIAEVVNGPGNMYKGFFWKTGIHNRKLNLNALLYGGKQKPEINKTLKKRLRIKKIDEQNPPAFLNLSTKTMPGEKWKDFPDYEGLYQVSNYGRVKALQKVTHGEKKMWMPEKIKLLTVDFRTDNNGKEIAGSTLVTLAKDGKKKTVSVPRNVYFLFVKKFKISDSNIRVYYKDGNTLNMHYKNLILKKGAWSFKNLRNKA
jgi:hypothetical protein